MCIRTKPLLLTALLSVLLTACANAPTTGAAMPAGGTSAPTPANVEVVWLGQSAFKITSPGGKVIVIGARYQPDLALVPIGGNFTMDPADAAWAVKDYIRPKTVIPMHDGANPPAKGTAKQFSDAMGSGSPGGGNIRTVIATPGEPVRS